MSDFETIPGGPALPPAQVLGRVATALPPGSPVRPGTLGGSYNGLPGLVVAEANASPAKNCVGLLAGQSSPNALTPLQYSGPLTLTEEQWAAVLDTGTQLQIASDYYLSAASPGKLTLTVPVASGSWAVAIGIALSPTTLLIKIGVAATAHA